MQNFIGKFGSIIRRYKLTNEDEIIEMFSDLIKSGASWSLQGHYGRAANAFIEGGWLDKEGNILKK
jgi:hypothetical protein